MPYPIRIIGARLMSPKMTEIILPYPISANRYWRKGRGGHIHVSTEAQEYKAEVAALCQVAGLEPVEGWVCLVINLYRPIRSGDLDNRLKVMIDALKGLAFGDDKFVKRIEAEMFDDKRNPRAEVRVEAVGQGV